MFKVTFATKSGSLQTFVDADSEYAVRKAVGARKDYEIFIVIACVKATPEEIAQLKAQQQQTAPDAQIPGREMDESWVTKRQETANLAYQAYEFGEGVEVEDASGWEHLSHGNEWTRPVFVRTDEGDDDGSSQKLVFTVRFEPGRATLTEAYAIDAKGSIWGAMPNDKVNDVVSDVLARARKYEFTLDENTVRDAVQESADLLDIELDEAQMRLACARVMRGDDCDAHTEADIQKDGCHG